MFEINFIALIGIGYLLGSLSAAIMVCQIFNYPDPRTAGSKNAGATNVNRLYGKKPAIITLFLDFLKGLIAVYLAQYLTLKPEYQLVVGLAAIIGHIYPIFFQFQGGKGVATVLGVLAGFYVISFLIFVFSWLIMAKVFKISSLSALIAAAINLIAYWFIFDFSLMVNLIITFITILIFFTHRSNIARLMTKKETKINR